MPTRSLFAISDDLLALAALLADIGGDVSDADAEAALTQWFTELGAERDTKLDHYAALIAELEARYDARQAEMRRLRALAERDMYTAKRLRERLCEFFKLHGIDRLSTARYELAVVRNGGPQRIEYLAEAVEAPPRYRHEEVTYRYDTDMVREALEAGEELAFARLVLRGERLRIR